MDKTVEKIVYYRSIFLNIVAVPVLPTPPSPESNVVVYSKESLIPGHLKEATLNWGKGMSFHKGVVLEIVLLRRKADMMGKTFSSSFVRDCSNDNAKINCFYFYDIHFCGIYSTWWYVEFYIPPMKHVCTQVPSVKSLQNCLTFSFEYRKYLSYYLTLGTITIYLRHEKVLKIQRYFQKSPILHKSSFIRHDTIYHHFDKSALTMAYCKALQSLQKILDTFTIKLIVA